MPWRKTCVMDERTRFIAAVLSGEETMSELCRRFGISRKTGHKWKNRYEACGLAGLADRSRAPHRNPRALIETTRAAILEVRLAHPGWGPRKVKAWLETNHGHRSWPAASTIGDLFDVAGLTRPRKRRRRTPPFSRPFADCRKPNDVWCIDFKGWFLTGDGTQVEPLTLSDGASRYLIHCQAVGRPDTAHVWPVLEAAFRAHGLPRTLRSDNGSPFASRAVGGLSRLAVKLIKAGVGPERIAPGKPQQNGRLERLHLTLKQETATPPARSLAEQMARFDLFRHVYNDERPHEALDNATPASRYRPSPRRYDGILRAPQYDQSTTVRMVRQSGEFKWKGALIHLSQALAGEPVGLTEIGENLWLIKYGPIALAHLREGKGLTRLPIGKPGIGKTTQPET